MRRLSAAALFLLMFAAVYPFGRVDLIGHATILASLLVILADPMRERPLEVVPRDRRSIWLIPAGFAVALAVTMISYAGQHHLIYQKAGGQLAALLRPESLRSAHEEAGTAPGIFWRGQEHYHGQAVHGPDNATTNQMMATMDQMHGEMNSVQVTGNADQDFVALMVPHHQSAVDMAQVYLKRGRDPALRRLAEQIVRSQKAEIDLMDSRVPGAAAAPGAASGEDGH